MSTTGALIGRPEPRLKRRTRAVSIIGTTAARPFSIKQDFAVVPPSTWLVDHVPWTEAEHRISAGSADKATAAELNIDEGTACLIIERRTWRNGEPITAVRVVHPGPLYDLTARFTPSS